MRLMRFKPRFSLLGLLLFVTVASLFLSLNTRPSVRIRGPCLRLITAKFDLLQSDQGWPFRYLTHLRFVSAGTAETWVADGWPRNEERPPAAFHAHWLLTNMLIGVCIATSVSCVGSRLVKRSRRRPRFESVD
jgi:hypothetical protein